VHQHQVGPVSFGEGDRIFAGMGQGGNVVAQALQPLAQAGRHDPLILDHQNTGNLHWCHLQAAAALGNGKVMTKLVPGPRSISTVPLSCSRSITTSCRPKVFALSGFTSAGSPLPLSATRIRTRESSRGCSSTRMSPLPVPWKACLRLLDTSSLTTRPHGTA